MPCRSDYMDPNEAEKDSREVCNHILYVHEQLKKLPEHTFVVPEWVRSGAAAMYGAPNKLEEATQILCGLCRGMDYEIQGYVIYDGRSNQARKLADWWDEHQKADLARERKENAIEEERKRVLRESVKNIVASLVLPIVVTIEFGSEEDAMNAEVQWHRNKTIRKGNRVAFSCRNLTKEDKDKL